MGKGYNTVDLDTGTKDYVGPSELTKGNHDGMPPRDSSYLSTDERGHIQASSLSGDNSKLNIAPQAKDLNHGAYLSVENGERDALMNGNTITSKKVAYASNQPGQRPDAYMVNDIVTMANGQQQEIHRSFANLQNSEQEALNAELDEHSDMLNVSNPEDTLRDSMSNEEYTDLVEKTDVELLDLRDEYQMDEYTSLSNSIDANDMWMESAENIGVEESVNAGDEWDMAVSEEANMDASDMSVGADLSADME